jgi:hypothetical protein
MERCVRACKVGVACFLVAILFLSSRVSAQSPPTAGLRVVFTQTPSNVTSITNATFGFTVADASGANPCQVSQSCAITCQVSR